MHERLVVTAIVKDNAWSVGRVFRKLSRLKASFGALAFVVYENNSTDGTKEALATLGREIPEFKVISEDLTDGEQERIAMARNASGKPCRIELIARARNIARDAVIEKHGDWELVLVVDADTLLFSLRDIERNAERVARGEADAIFANGLTKWLYYRDAFAFRSIDYPLGPEFLGEEWWSTTKRKIQGRYHGKALVPVRSAFGGAAIYSMKAFKAGRYAALTDKRYLASQGASMNPIPNSGYSLPIVCEHVPFCYALREFGFDRLAIDPAWRLLFRD